MALANASCTSRVIDAWVSTDADGTRRPEIASGSQFVEFGADIRAVYCIVELSNGREDATIEGVLHQDSVTDPVSGADNTDRDIIVATISQLAPVGTQQRVALALLPPKDASGKEDEKVPLPGGAYRCEFALRTKPVPEGEAPVADATVQFKIKPTKCPPAQIKTGEECTFFAEGTSCAQAGERSVKKGTETCICSAGAWQCG